LSWLLLAAIALLLVMRFVAYGLDGAWLQRLDLFVSEYVDVAAAVLLLATALLSHFALGSFAPKKKQASKYDKIVKGVQDEEEEE